MSLNIINSPESRVWKDEMEQKAKLFSWKSMQIICSHVKKTRIRFWPCKKKFALFTTAIEFNYKTIDGRNMKLALLNPK
ncbi:hypothetical protein IGI04_023180, partial [Brassica rapa subsp. trilocularis]